MDPSIIKLIIFFFAVATIVMFYKQSFVKQVKPVVKPTQKKVSKPTPSFEGIGEQEPFWAQVFDTDSADEARKARGAFAKMKVRCLIYRQGKKDVFGAPMKHYGISVPQDCVEKAQSILTELTL